jgi:Immunity protein 10
VILSYIAHACSVARLDDLNTFLVIIADRSDSPRNTIELQCAIEADDQDRALGMNTYGIVLSSGATHYGGITRCSVSQRRLIFAFSEDAEAALGFSGADITLELSDAEVEALRQGLIHVFALSKAVPHVLEL